MLDYAKYAAILIVLIIIQKVFIHFIDVTSYSVTPDIVLVGLVFTAMKKGKIYGSLAGFLTGLAIDFISFSFLGLMALSKASAGFLAGFFSNERKVERYLNTYIFILIILACSVLQNLIYYILYFQGSTLGFSDVLLRYVIPTSVYTGIFGIFPLIYSRKKKIR